LTSQNKDQTQAPTSSRTDNGKVIKHMHRTEVIKHMSNTPRVEPIRSHRRLMGCKHMYKRKRLELICNNNSFIQFVFKHIINALALSKATEKSAREENKGNNEEWYGRATYQCYSCFNSSLDLVRPHREYEGSSTLGSSPLDASMLSSYTSAPPMPAQEHTKGGDPTPVASIDGAITTETIQAIISWSIIATVRCTLPPKNSS
jgi:hypothetical protein